MGSITKDGITQLDLIVANDMITRADDGHRDSPHALAEATEIILDYLDAYPDDHVGLFALGRAFITAKHPGAAAQIYERLTESQPDQWQVWTNLARCYDDMHRYADAKVAYRRALDIDPDCGEAMIGLSVSHVMSGEPMEAIEYSRMAIEVGHKVRRARTNIGYSKLMMGEYGTGWDEYAHGLGYTVGRQVRMYGDEEPWDGRPGKDVKLIVYGEQGLGENIAWLSILPEVARDVDVVAVDIEGKIAGLIQRTFPDLRVFGTLHQTDFDWPPPAVKPTHRAAISTLCQYYRRSLDSFPGTPYLRADPERRLQWRALLDSLGKGKKVGLAWSGGNKATNRAGRSLALRDLDPLTRLPHVHWVSLEYKDRSEEIAEARARGVQIHDWPRASQSQDYEDVAALVAELDMVVAVPTAAVHCAGALGVEAHIICPPYPLFDCPKHIDRMPYYFSTHIHRRDDYGDKPLAACLQSIVDATGLGG